MLGLVGVRDQGKTSNDEKSSPFLLINLWVSHFFHEVWGFSSIFFAAAVAVLAAGAVSAAN